METLRAALREYRSRNVLLLFALGFGSGVPLLLVLSTLTMWLSEAGLSKAGIAAFQYVGTAWAVKFLWSPSVDKLRLPWLTARLGQRRSWMILGQLGIAGGLFALSTLTPGSSLGAMAGLCVFIAASSATYDIALDAWRVSILDDEEQGPGASAVQLGYRLAMLVTGAGALFLADALRTDPQGAVTMARGIAASAGSVIQAITESNVAAIRVPNLHLAEEIWPKVYRVMAGLMALSVVATFIADEPPSDEEVTPGAGLTAQFRDAVVTPFTAFFQSQGGIALALLTLTFVLFFRLSDSIAGALMNPFLNELGFAYSEIGRIQKLFGVVATFVGIFVGGWLYKALGANKTLWIAAILQTSSNLMFVLQAMVGADTVMLHVTIGVENISGGLGAAAFVAWLSSLCSKRYSATQYALLSSLAMVGRTVIAGSVGAVADHYGWIAFFLMSTAAGIPGILLLYILTRAQRRESSASQMASSS